MGDYVIANSEMRLVMSFGSKTSNEYYYNIYLQGNNEKIGTCGIRLNNDDKYCGNIQYEIYEQYRGHNYASQAIKLISNIAIKGDVKSLNIISRPNNKAAIKTIEKLGAHFVEVLKIPKKTRLYKKNQKVNVYEWNLKGENDNDRYKLN